MLGKDGHPPSKVFVEAMPYTQSLLAKGKAIGYHAKAAPPTVTMPRLKVDEFSIFLHSELLSVILSYFFLVFEQAMVSGAIGGFLDVAFNFNTQALLDDNLIGQSVNSF